MKKTTLHILCMLSIAAPSFVYAEESAPIPGAILIALLAAHVVLGLIGVGALYAVAMALFKKLPPISFLRVATLIAVIGYVGSWFTGGIYYVKYYGGAVKAAIKAGEHPWAHAFFMEAKEHVFLLLPFIALALMAIVWVRHGELLQNEKIRRNAAFLAMIGFAIGVYCALSGIIISGSV